ncbi:MAG: hypothetical protein IMZ58_12280 [Thermoplasmata archaeon]|nr:hypothetical protein [Thermoplasmata archaeon]
MTKLISVGRSINGKLELDIKQPGEESQYVHFKLTDAQKIYDFLVKEKLVKQTEVPNFSQG